FFIALFPGFLNFFLLLCLILDERQTNPALATYPGLSVIVCAYNEEKCIYKTITSLLEQAYPGPIEILVMDDGSTDNTYEIASQIKSSFMKIYQLGHQGKANALNTGLVAAKYDLIVSLDADTFLHKKALMNITHAIEAENGVWAAIAGSVYVQTGSWIQALQKWDYLQGISTVKKVQSLFHCIMVAQGAFSIYRKKFLQDIGGWPNKIGEDIVITWGLLEKKHKIGWAKDAIATTSAPNSYKAFFYQRARWARGLIEAFRTHPKILLRRQYASFYVYTNLLFPIMDFAYVFILTPGIFAAFLGNYLIAGLFTLLVLPFAIASNLIIYFKQKEILNAAEYPVPKINLSFVAYMLFYQMIMAPACVYGYCQEFFARKRIWGPGK
ncbi:MAG: glycosyltransferase family 2 protein, partial [Gammaproteobacteria bacterium]